MIKFPLIGILGGMGPYASLRCYELILNESINYSNGIKNNDFPHVIIDSIPVKELTNNLDNLNETVSSVSKEYLRLKDSGVNIFMMACNTMHLYYKDIFKDDIGVENLSLIKETVKQVKLDGHLVVGVLGTVTTIKSGLYGNNLFKEGIKDVYIDDDIMLEKINNIIKKIIGGVKKFDEFDIKVLEKSISILKNKGATGVILGCTELPIAFESLKIDFQLYDPLLLTVKVACKIYYNN